MEMLKEMIMIFLEFFILGTKRCHDAAPSQECKNPRFEYLEREIRTEDGVKLVASLLKPREMNDKTLFFIICHGTACNRYSYVPICGKDNALENENICALFMDYRGFGDSEGMFSPEKANLDIDACLKYMEGIYEPSKIYLWGHSLGGAAILEYAKYVKTNGLKKRYSKAILLDTFTDAKSVVMNVLEKWIPKLAITTLEPFLDEFLNEYLSYDSVKNIKFVDNPKDDLMIIHGKEDDFVPVDHGKRLAEEAGIELTLVEGVHNHTIGSKEAWGKILKFVREEHSESSASSNPISEQPEHLQP